MTPTADVDPDAALRHLAREFAESLNARLDAVLTHVPPIVAEVQGGNNPRVFIHHVDPSVPGSAGNVASIPLEVDGEPLLEMQVTMRCIWDRRQQFLTIAESAFVVQMTKNQRRPPLWRYEYDRNKSDRLPAAHLQIHAHRDEVVYLMMRARNHRGKVRDLTSQNAFTLDHIHFPVGGHRFRPCVEDVLEFTINELGVTSVKTGWRERLAEGRAEWRRIQLRAAIRDAPEIAAQALRDLGYAVTADATERPDDVARLSAL